MLENNQEFTEDKIGFIKLVDKTNQDFPLKIVNTARISYGNSKEVFDEKDKKLVSYLWEHQHTCYAEDTEVLTKEGFVKWEKINKDSLLATVDPVTNTFSSFEKPKRIINSDYSGEMYHYLNNDIDLLVTPNHYLYASRTNTISKRKNPEFELFRCNEIETDIKKISKEKGKRPLRFVKSCKNNQKNILHQNPAWFGLYGFFIGDGYAKLGNQIKFHLKKERECTYLRNICNKLPVILKENPTYGGRISFTITYKNIGKDFRNLFYNKNKEKSFPSIFMNMSSQQFNYFYEGLMSSDGSKKRSTFIYATSSVQLKEQLVALFTINNKSVSVNYTKAKNILHKGMYRINVASRRHSTRFNDNNCNQVNIKEYKGKVYCAEVSTGLLIVRRNNKIVLSGNSPFRHSFYTFHVKATLSVFRQWLKHQVGSTWRTYEINGETVCLDIVDLFFDTDKGCSWNELSRRYATPKYEYYVPQELRSNPPHGNKQASGEYVNPLSSHDIQYMESPLEEMRLHTEKSIHLYKKLIANGVAKEIARDVLPGNLYTEAYWTVSLQAVMLFLNLRDSDTAQFEIRQYARIIKNLIKEDLVKAGLLNE